jgi:hypothetical protein
MAGKDLELDPDLIRGFLFIRELLMHAKAHLNETNMDYDRAIAYVTQANRGQMNTMAKEVNDQILEALLIAKELHEKLAASSLQPAGFDAMVDAGKDGPVQ